MPILPDSPIVVPQKNFDRLGISRIEISPSIKDVISGNSPDISSMTAIVSLVPYNSSTGEIFPEGISRLEIKSDKLMSVYQTMVQVIQSEYSLKVSNPKGAVVKG